MDKVNLQEKLGKFDDYWSPKIVSEFNGHDVMVVKVLGEFNWHSHATTDDFFLVLSGELTIQLHSGNITLKPGELYVVPEGVDHCPIANIETHVLIIEPKGTPNTGDEKTAVKKTKI